MGIGLHIAFSLTFLPLEHLDSAAIVLSSFLLFFTLFIYVFIFLAVHSINKAFSFFFSLS